MAKKEEEQSRIKKLKRKKLKKYLYILIPILVLVGAGASYAAVMIGKAKDIAADSYENDGRENGSSLRDSDIDPNVDNVSILFIGVDQSEKRERNNESNELTDALILATLNKEDKSVKMVSIPRDSYVNIPEVGYKDKITHAHAFGGVTATLLTVEELFDIPVDYYVKINFNAFIDVVDELNGIRVDVPYELYEQDSNDVARAIHLLPGEQLLNGEEALALARTRKKDSDIERGKRQQDIIKAIVDRSVSFNTILKLDDLMQAVGDNMTTNMSFNEIKSFVSYGSTGKLDIESLSLEGSDLWTDAYYYQLNDADLTEKKETLKEHLELDTNSTQADSSDSTESAQNSSNLTQ